MAKERQKRDYYPTPIWCIDALMSHLKAKSGDIFSEPAMGDGRVFDRFPTGHEKKWAEISAHRDYLNPKGVDLSADIIVTNPPFSHAMEFIRTAIDRDLNENGTVCMLLRMSMLGSKERADFWRKFPVTNLFTLTPRPQFVHGGSDNSEYAWFVWDYGNRFDLPALWSFKREEHDAEYAEKLREKQLSKIRNQIRMELKAKRPELTNREINKLVEHQIQKLTATDKAA
ncbi:TPA: DNA methyltransferase [Vibrio alginolyticus]|uniref:DNA methyltransferase n=1 Tax=Vibrio alginolyticus TaxID=663 RepID=UPI000ABA0F6D|nr:DNA methyltransferase [Vibrio alginolyticus]MDM4739649.1 DNA methyltransferase [Vibrio alginolyticus]MDM4759998.1 DNA methyltransferase [Vibrio alginolyticus]